MFIIEDVDIKVKEVLESELAVLHDDGDKVWSAIRRVYWDENRIRRRTVPVLDFDGVERVSFAFLNATIGRVFMDRYMNSNGSIKWKNTSHVFELEERIQMVIENVRLKNKINDVKSVINNDRSPLF